MSKQYKSDLLCNTMYLAVVGFAFLVMALFNMFLNREKQIANQNNASTPSSTSSSSSAPFENFVDHFTTLLAIIVLLWILAPWIYRLFTKKSAQHSIFVKTWMRRLLVAGLFFSAVLYLVDRYAVPEKDKDSTVGKVFRYSGLAVWLLVILSILGLLYKYNKTQGDPKPVWLWGLVTIALIPLAISCVLK